MPTHLKTHADKHCNKSPAVVIDRSPSAQQTPPVNNYRWSFGPDEPPLGIGDIEKPAIGGVEQGDSKRKPDAHDPKLGNFRHQRTIPVAELHSKPVEMHETYCCKGYW